MSRGAIGIAIMAMLAAIGLQNCPPKALPHAVTLRELAPRELRVQGMIPVVSDYGDWYDGCNYSASPEWNAAHGIGGNMWTSTCMACLQGATAEPATLGSALTGSATYTLGTSHAVLTSESAHD